MSFLCASDKRRVVAAVVDALGDLGELDTLEPRRPTGTEGRLIGPVTHQSTAAQVCLPANPRRRGFTIQNAAGASTLFIALSSGDGRRVSSTLHTVFIGAGEYYETPPILREYTGDVFFISSGAVGTFSITELVIEEGA